MKKKETTKKSLFAVPIAIIIWILAGCAHSAPAQPAATPSAQTISAQARAWKAGPGFAAWKKIMTDMGGVNDPSDLTPAQLARTIKDVKAAEKYPAPPSVDPGGYYLDALVHLDKGLVAIQNDNPFAALTQMTAAASSAQHVKKEVKDIDFG